MNDHWVIIWDVQPASCVSTGTSSFKSTLRLFLFLACWLILPANGFAQGVNVRVAIVAYEDFHQELAGFEACFSQLENRDPHFNFQLAVGSYSDVQYWMERQWVDLAVLTPGVFANLLQPTTAGTSTADYRYLTSILIPEIRSGGTEEVVEARAFRDTFHPVCLVPEDSPLKDLRDLKRAIVAGETNLLLVDPMSVSGCIAPLAAMSGELINPQGQLQFTRSHSQSIRMLKEGQSSKSRVAFVWDDAKGVDPELADGVRKLPFPALESFEIPHDLIVARRNFSAAIRIGELLGEYQGERLRFSARENWRSSFEQVQQWMAESQRFTGKYATDAVTLDGIARMLLQYARSQPAPPRVALVLSGGGAKCSYQVGVVSALEEKLAALRMDNPESAVDIDLVVGTSGGAINSIPIAMRVSASPEGRRLFRETWQNLDQRDIVQPSFLVRMNMGVWFAMLQCLAVVMLVGRFSPAHLRSRRVFIALLLLAICEFLLVNFRLPWNWLGQGHVVHHAWLWLGLAMDLSAWSLLIGVAVLLGSRWVRTRRQQHYRRLISLLRLVMLAGILVLPFIQVVSILLLEETLSSGRGMERAIAEKLSGLINGHLAQQNESPLSMSPMSPARRLQSVSQQIMDRSLLQRDLIITGSCLEQSSQELPSDLYFYAAARDSDVHQPHFGNRGLSFEEHRNILLDVVMGSGSIYPVFPARAVAGVPRKGASVLLVDGGYSHNSPVEAAVLWGATHVILVEATPRSQSHRGNLLVNAAASFHHLHQQAQLLDVRSRSKVRVFSLAPQAPHICVLDFADNLVSNSMNQGYRDAMQEDVAHARIRREIGEPTFREVGESL